MSPLPQGFKKNVRFIKQKVGPEKRQEYLDDIDYKGAYLPKGITYEDIDGSFIDFVNKDLELIIGGESVPVIFLTIQRWAEFSKTWELSDKFKNVKMPFITVVREPDVQVGTNQVGLWNIPGNKLYSYIKVPTFEGGRKGIDTYKIPQPTSVDITYEVKLFCNRMKDLNGFHEKVQTTFNSRQFYINVKGHPMPVHFESNGDESQFDFDKRRFYVQNFEMKTLGYIMDENSFEVIPTINRAVIFTELIEGKTEPKILIDAVKDVDEITFTIIIKANHSGVEFNIPLNYDIELTDVLVDYNMDNLTFEISGVQKQLPFSLTSNEILTLKGDRDETKETKLTLRGIIK